MTTKEIIGAAIACLTIVACVSIYAYTSTIRYERDAIVNAQTEVQKTRIVEEEKTHRAIEIQEEKTRRAVEAWKFPWN